MRTTAPSWAPARSAARLTTLLSLTALLACIALVAFGATAGDRQEASAAEQPAAALTLPSAAEENTETTAIAQASVPPPSATPTSQASLPSTIAVNPGARAAAAAPRPLAPTLLAYSDELASLADATLSSVVSISTRRPVPNQIQPFFFFDPHNPFGFGPPRHAPVPQPQQRFADGLGSGVIATADGVIVTNHHVVDGATELTVTLSDGRSTSATVVGSDPGTDVAVIRLNEPLADLQPARFADSESVRPGELVMAIGNPFGLSSSVSMGIVSAVGRAGMGITDFENFIQTDAAINPGNSGGALVDMRGALVGINTAIFSRSGGYQGIGFAIPSNMVRSIMDQLVENGAVARGWLGVQIAAVPPKVASALGIGDGDGVLVAMVEPNGPAAAAGLREGDVVLAVDDRQTGDVLSLRTTVADLAPGHTARLDVLRRDGRHQLRVELGERPVLTARAQRR